jgi:hypothetical protein
MIPRASDDAVPEAVIPVATATPQLRRVPVGTPLATPIVRLPLAEGTAPAARIAAPRLRGWIAGVTALAVALAASYALYVRTSQREALDAAYPVVATASEAATLEREIVRWSTGERRLAGTLARFEPPALDSLVGAGACMLGGEGTIPTRFAAGPDLATEVRAWMDDTLAVARRGRFASDAARDQLLGRLAGPVLVTAGAVVYAFDPGTGELACAGTGALRAVP